LHEDYPGQYKTPTPKSLISLVQEKHGTTMSYSTVNRGKDGLLIFVYVREGESWHKTSVVLDEAKRFKYLSLWGLPLKGLKS